MITDEVVAMSSFSFYEDEECCQRNINDDE